MKKQLLAITLLSAFAGMAQAENNTNIVMYGTVDTGFIKQTGSDVQMGENYDSAFGIRGTEDLGGNYKAFFQIEKRFYLNDGTSTNPSIEWEGASNVGISGNFGTVRLGRVNELPTETIRTLDPFNENSIASMTYSTQRSIRISNTIRYDSPQYKGLQFGATYSLGMNTKGADANNAFVKAGANNDGYAASLMYDNKKLTLLANWSRLVDSNKSYDWNLGGAYTWGPLRLSLAYQYTKDKGWKNGGKTLSGENGVADSSLINGVQSKQHNWILGLNYNVGPGTFMAAFNYVKVKDVKGVDPASGSTWGANDSADLKKYAIGYTYNLSKRTSLYGMVAYTDYENNAISNFYNGADFNNDSVTGVQVGITHNF